jgi:hypothetical protein
MVRPGTVPTYPFSTTVRLSQSTYRRIVGLNSSFSNFLSTKISQSVRSPSCLATYDRKSGASVCAGGPTWSSPQTTFSDGPVGDVGPANFYQ